MSDFNFWDKFIFGLICILAYDGWKWLGRHLWWKR